VAAAVAIARVRCVATRAAVDATKVAARVADVVVVAAAIEVVVTVAGADARAS
jgi:hypothetical protein